MKKLSILIYLLVLIFPLDTYSQSGPQRVLGTFIYKKEVYNYEFIQEGAASYSFKLSAFQKAAETPEATSPEQEGEEPNETPEVASTEQADEATTVTPEATIPTQADEVPVEATGVTPSEQGEEEPSNIFAEFSQGTFTTIFQAIMRQKYPDDSNSEEYNNKPIEVFFKIKARLDLIDDEPVTAFMILKDGSIKSYLKGNTSVYYSGALSGLWTDHLVKRVNVETEDGAIKNISAHLVDPKPEILSESSPSKYLEFKNHYPISISGKFDPDRFADTKLYCFNCKGIKGLTRYILLSELLILDIVLANDKEDYSPSNRTFSLSPLESVVELKKERRSRILEVAAFTDFVGLDQEQPNGLIQVEVRRSININTRYYHSLKPGKSEDLPDQINFSNVDTVRSTATVRNKSIVYDIFYNDPKTDSARRWHEPKLAEKDFAKIKIQKFHPVHFNFLGSIEPRLLFSKLEENNKYLVLDATTTLDPNEPPSPVAGKAFLDPVQVYRHQLTSFGTDLNLFKIAFPQAKFNWRILNISYFWYRTRLQESNSATEDATIPLNIQYWQFGTKVYFRPDSRWGVNIGLNYICQSIWNASYEFQDKKGLMQTSFDAHLKTSDLSTLFFRFKWTHQRKNRDNNFTQVQLGYSLDLFSQGYTMASQ